MKKTTMKKASMKMDKNKGTYTSNSKFANTTKVLRVKPKTKKGSLSKLMKK